MIMINKGIKKGVYFDDIHSFNDLNLILAPFVPVPATPKTNHIDITGGNGSLDLTEALGEVTYKDREFSFTFSVNPSDTMSFDEKVSQVSNALNGKACKITLDRDSEYYWLGRCTVDKYAQDKNLKQISVKATVRPYKLKQNITVVETTAGAVSLKNDRKPVVPTITVDNQTTLTFKGNEYTLNPGTHKILDIQLCEGENLITVDGSGHVKFEYQEGSL